MKIKSILLKLSICVAAGAASLPASAVECGRLTRHTSVPPFFVFNDHGRAFSEVFVGGAAKIIPKDSFLRCAASYAECDPRALKADPNKDIEVEVLNVNANAFDLKNPFVGRKGKVARVNQLMPGANLANRTRVQVRDFFRVKAGALQPLPDVFYMRKDAPYLKGWSELASKSEDTAFESVRCNGDYVYSAVDAHTIYYFFDTHENAENPSLYSYDAVKGEFKTGNTKIRTTVQMMAPVLPYLVPTEEKDSAVKEFFQDTMEDSWFDLYKLLVLNVRSGRTAISLLNFPVHSDQRSCEGRGFRSAKLEGPFGSSHYEPDDCASSDIRFQPASACKFLGILKEHQQACKEPGCELQFGDMFHDHSWKVHVGHGNGDCVDIRLQRKADARNPSGRIDPDGDYAMSISSRGYDREKTIKLALEFIKAGSCPVLTADTKLIARVAQAFPGGRMPSCRSSEGTLLPLVKYDADHDDHLHVCLPFNSAKIRNACEE